MSVVLPTLGCFVLYAVGYLVYARYLSRHIFALSDTAQTPAHTLRDDVDYVPTRRSIVFGHHFASITGLAPMLGPAVAVIWGWLPAMLWVVCGAVLIGCVHDFSALVVSLRAQGKSIGKVAEGIIGPRAKTLFHLVIFFGIALAMGVFVFVIASLFSLRIDEHTAGFPSAVTPSAGMMVVALVVGYLLHRKGWGLMPLTLAAFATSLVLVYLGHLYPTLGLDAALWPERPTWIGIQLAYALVASILPVWLLLQARDFVNSLLLYLGVGTAYIGLFVLGPTFQAPAVRMQVEGAPSIFPFVFIVIACGAASGFHGLVSSGTTAKQLDKETDATAVGYGGMIAESLLGLLAVLATTAGFASTQAWETRYVDWHAAQGLAGNITAFIHGTARFMSSLGVDAELAASFIAVVVVSFALTTLDSATRLLRYNIEEMGDTLLRHTRGTVQQAVQWTQNRYVSSGLAVGVIALFAFYKVEGKPAALALWTLFGTTNQLLAGLTLLTVTVYLKQKGKPWGYTGLPAVAMMLSTLVAMVTNLSKFVSNGQMLLLVVGGALFVIALWVALEAVITWRRDAASQHG